MSDFATAKSVELPSENTVRSSTSRRRLLGNTVLNFLGYTAPLAVAALSIPVLISHLGDERFGILSLAYVALGYTSLLDLGIGRSLTKMLAKGSASDSAESGSLIWTSLSLMTGLGFLAMFVLILLVPVLTQQVIKVDPDLKEETVQAFYWISYSIPFVILTAGLRGVFEARQRFGLSSSLRMLIGILTFVGPLVVLPFSNHLAPVMISLLIGRVLTCVLHAAICLKITPELRSHRAFRSHHLRPLLSYGGWVSLNSLAGSLTQTLDRFVIAAVISAAAVTYYATPYEMISKLTLITVAFSGVLFPTFASLSFQDLTQARSLYKRSCIYTIVVLLPIALGVAIFAKFILTVWLGAEFAAKSYRVAQALAVATFVFSIQAVPWTWLQGLGRADIPAKLTLIELPPYIAILWLLTRHFGIEGTAVAWFIRVSVDTAALYLFARNVEPANG